jgi:peptide-methionine (S)-S-oxide reductase
MRLPIGIDVEQYKAQAEELLERGRLGEAEALARFREHIPKRESSSPSSGVRLADAQLVIARENGFASWPRFNDYLVFRNAVAALDAGDVARLEALIDAHPGVLRHECRVGEWYEEGYFSGARLLQHVAGNPDRGPLPPNIVDIARLLATRHFDRKAAEYTIGLLLTSRRASEAEVAMPLIDILVAAGARFDVGAPQLLSGPLLNAAPETAEALVRRGAKVDLRHAAGLGDVASLRSMLEKPTPREELEEALAFACIRDQRDSAALLLARGAKGDVLVAPGGQTPRTALHEAANRGFVELVEMLLAAGADATVKDSRWGGTAAAWADEGDFPALATRLRSNP